MNESKYTPGPWTVDLEDVPEYSPITVMAPGCAIVATVNNADDFPCLEDDQLDAVDKEARANARLIAAAPDLLTACGAAFHALKSYEYGNSAPDLAKETAEAVRAAIAKAATNPKETP